MFDSLIFNLLKESVTNSEAASFIGHEKKKNERKEEEVRIMFGFIYVYYITFIHYFFSLRLMRTRQNRLHFPQNSIVNRKRKRMMKM